MSEKLPNHGLKKQFMKKPKSNHEVIEAWRKVIRGENHEKKR